jgi:hypothetical protein
MARFLVELYVSKTNCAAVAVETERLSRAVAELTAQGRPVRILQSIFVPEDETCLLLVEAATADDVHKTARIAALPVERVVEAADDTTNYERSDRA